MIYPRYARPLGHKLKLTETTEGRSIPGNLHTVTTDTYVTLMMQKRTAEAMDGALA